MAFTLWVVWTRLRVCLSITQLVSLRFLPDFRAKNKNSLSDAQSVEIKNLSNLLNPDDEDKLIYLASTHSYRLGNRSFFLSLILGTYLETPCPYGCVI